MASSPPGHETPQHRTPFSAAQAETKEQPQDGYTPTRPAVQTPFHHTKAGLIIICVTAVVIVALVVGGVVGGLKHGNATTMTAASGLQSQTGAAGQGVSSSPTSTSRGSSGLRSSQTSQATVTQLATVTSLVTVTSQNINTLLGLTSPPSTTGAQSGG